MAFYPRPPLPVHLGKEKMDGVGVEPSTNMRAWGVWLAFTHRNLATGRT